MVIDTSALLAVFFNEEHGPWVADKLRESAGLRMSVVNYAETLILIQDRQPHLFDELNQRILHSSIRLVAPTATQGAIAAAARMRFPLNLGDCFAYALAKEEDSPLLTLDSDFQHTDIELILPGGRKGRRSTR